MSLEELFSDMAKGQNPAPEREPEVSMWVLQRGSLQ